MDIMHRINRKQLKEVLKELKFNKYEKDEDLNNSSVEGILNRNR